MNLIKLLFSIATLSTLSSCLFKALTPPTSQELESADYGPPPPTQDKAIMRTLVVRRLKDVGYFDPNSAEVEDCSTPEKHWEYDTGRSTMEKTAYSFGWNFLCDVNVKNRQGGYTGFHRFNFLFSKDTVIGSDQFFNANTWNVP